MSAPTCESLGIKLSSAVGDTGTIAEAEAGINEYLRGFQADGRCPCGRPLGGILGSFTWGIIHGEGACSRCGFPARAFHEIDLGDLGTLTLNLVLAYAPELVTARLTPHDGGA